MVITFLVFENRAIVSPGQEASAASPRSMRAAMPAAMAPVPGPMSPFVGNLVVQVGVGARRSRRSATGAGGSSSNGAEMV